MSRKTFLNKSEKTLTATQHKQVKGYLEEGRRTPVRLIVENEYDLARKQLDEIMQRNIRDEVIESRMMDVQAMYNEYMETFEL